MTMPRKGLWSLHGGFTGQVAYTPQECGRRAVRLVHRAVRICAGGSVIFGLVALGGRIFAHETFENVLPGAFSLKASASFSFVLAGVSLWLLTNVGQTTVARRIATSCAALVIVLGLLTLAKYLLGADFSVAQQLFGSHWAEVIRGAARQSSPNNAIAFIPAGLALLTLDLETRQGLRPSQLFALLAATVGLLAVMGHAYRVPILYSPMPHRPTVVLVAVGLFLFSVAAIFARPDRELMSHLTSARSGGMLLRRILPVVLVGLPLPGWVCWLGQGTGFYSIEYRFSLLILLSMVVFTYWIFRFARSLNRIEAAQSEALALSRTTANEAQLMQAQWKDIFESAPGPIIGVDREGRILLTNAQTEKVFGYPPDELRGKPVEILDSKPHTSRTERPVEVRRAHVLWGTIKSRSLRML